MGDTFKAHVLLAEDCPPQTYEIIVDALTKSGVEILKNAKKAALDEAWFLVLAAPDADKLNAAAIESDWQYFLDEIKWKRKSGGEAVIIDCSALSFAPSKLPYSLKKCKRFRLEKIDEAADYISRGLNETAAACSSPLSPPAFDAGNKEKSEENDVPNSYRAAEDHELNFNKDGEIGEGVKNSASPKKESGACRVDHVFGGHEDKGYKTLVRDDSTQVCRKDHVFLEVKERQEIKKEEPFSEYPEYPVFKRERKKKKYSAATIIIFIIAAIVCFGVIVQALINLISGFISFEVSALTQPLLHTGSLLSPLYIFKIF